jgi:hypothetical protein
MALEEVIGGLPVLAAVAGTVAAVVMAPERELRVHVERVPVAPTASFVPGEYRLAVEREESAVVAGVGKGVVTAGDVEQVAAGVAVAAAVPEDRIAGSVAVRVGDVGACFDLLGRCKVSGSAYTSNHSAAAAAAVVAAVG